MHFWHISISPWRSAACSISSLRWSAKVPCHLCRFGRFSVQFFSHKPFFAPVRHRWSPVDSSRDQHPRRPRQFSIFSKIGIRIPRGANPLLQRSSIVILQDNTPRWRVSWEIMEPDSENSCAICRKRYFAMGCDMIKCHRSNSGQAISEL